MHTFLSRLLLAAVLILPAGPRTTAKDATVALTVEAGPNKVLLGESAVWIEAEPKITGIAEKKAGLTYSWEHVNGPAAKLEDATKKRARLSGVAEGAHRLRVTTTTAAGVSATAEVTVTREPAPAGAEIPANDPNLQFNGRILSGNPKAPELGWPGCQIIANFEGTSVRVKLEDGKWGQPSHFYAIIDGQDEDPLLIACDNRQDYLVAHGLADGPHTLNLFRLTGGWSATTKFLGLVLDPEKKLLAPPARPARRIEFYGDSITEGSYMEGFSFTNNYRAYGAVCARKLGAEYRAVAKGGMGMIRGFTLPQTLPVMWQRTLPLKADALWDFSQWQPQVAVVNIFQNDKWTQKKVPAEDFIAAYVKFLGELRGKYPRALIVCALGSMDATEAKSPWPGYVEAALAKHRAATGDKQAEIFFFPFLGRKGHPNRLEAAGMGDSLAAFLEAKGPEIWK